MCICTRRHRRNAVQVLEYKVLSIAPSRMYEFYILLGGSTSASVYVQEYLYSEYSTTQYLAIVLYSGVQVYLVLNSSPFRTRSRDFGLPSRDITVPNGIDSLQRCVYIQANTNP